MPTHSLAETLAPVVASVSMMLILLAIVFMVLRHRRSVTEAKLKAVADLAERGNAVPFDLIFAKPRPPQNSDLRIGMVLASTGVGALLFAFSLPVHPAWGLGLLPLFAGLGYLITWMIGRTSLAGRSE
jgi:hypothetical protein